jgi:hypothetical protein
MSSSSVFDQLRGSALYRKVERTLDSQITKVRSGEEVAQEEIQKSGELFEAYYQFLCRRHSTEDNKLFSDPDRMRFYVNAVKLTALNHPNHGGWPFKAGIRSTLLEPFKKQVAINDDPWLLFCAIMPALASRDLSFAAETFSRLRDLDEDLADIAMAWAEHGWEEHGRYNLFHLDNFRAAVGLEAFEPPANDEES